MRAYASEPGTLPDREPLVSILSRSVTLANGYNSPCPDDDLRMLARIGPQFVGRAAYVWVTKADDEAHFQQAAAWTTRVHGEVGPDVVLQAAIFEAIYPTVGEIPIPEWVFEDLGETPEARSFSYEAMRGRVHMPDQGGGTPWTGGMVPDLAQPETLRWFYYRARRYLEAGYEAIHLGQAHLVAGADPGYRHLAELVRLIRLAATRHARRGWVILDAHGHGIAIAGRLLFDFTSRPLSARCLVDHSGQIALIKRGQSLGGLHPGGWACKESPTLVEVDNWGGYSLAPDSPDWENPLRLAMAGRWGYDDICWFARLSDAGRHDFLRYAHRWARLQGEDWYFQMPLARSLGRANITNRAGEKVHRYRANSPSAACPEGFGDEDAVIAAWREPDPAVHRAPNPVPASPDANDLTVPEPVTVTGPLQPLLGGVPGDASCPWSRLHGIGPGRFARTFCLPLAGRFPFTITTGGTMSDPTNQGGLAGGNPFLLDVPSPGTLFRITFDHATREVQSVIIEH